MLQEDSNDYILERIVIYTQNKNYEVALKIAKLAGLSVDDILKAEWDKKCNSLIFADDGTVEDKQITYFVAQCSEAFKNAGVSLNKSIEFLSGIPRHISEQDQKFYAFRVIMGWFEGNHVYGEKREQIEHEMWSAYLLTDAKSNIVLNDYQATLKFVLNNQKEPTAFQKMDMMFEEKPFSLTLHEIEVESDVINIEKVEILEESDDIDRWQNAISKLLELKLLVEAFRLSVLFKTSNEYGYRTPVCPVQIMRTCLKLAEGTLLPYDLPQELRLVISSPTLQNKLTGNLIF